MDIIKLIENSRKQEKEGVSLEKQCILNFFKNNLNLKVLDVKEDEIDFVPTKVTAENLNIPGQKYFFEVDANFSLSTFEPFSLIATLVKVVNKDLSYECQLEFRFKDEFQRNDAILKKDLNGYLKGKEKDPELEFILYLLKEKTEKYNSNYVEKVTGNKRSFELSLEGRKVIFSEGFQNTIQVDFQNGDYCVNSIQLIYREIGAVEIEEKLNKIMSFVENFVNGNLIVSSFNFNSLVKFANNHGIWMEFNSRAMVEQKFGTLLVDFILGDTLTCNSLNMKINVKEDVILLKVNHLMQEETFEFASIEDLVNEVSELNGMISEAIKKS